MNNRRAFVSRCAALITAFALAFTWNDARAQQGEAVDQANNLTAVPAQPDDEQARLAAQLAEMKLAVARLGVFELQGDQRRSVDIVEKPLLHFRDEVRRHLDGTFWVWGREGRPVATGEVWSNRPDSHVWWVAMASTTTNLTGCELDGRAQWTPKTAGVSFARLASEAKPSNNATLVQTQMRSLARRFSTANPDLRLLARPVHTYKDRKNGILAGALFAFVHETNPEISLLIEAVEKDSEAGWQYALARSSSGALEVRLDDKTIWSLPALEPVTGLPGEPFLLLELKPKSDAQPPKSADKIQ